MILIAIILFLPSSRDPLTTVPSERLDLWPLTRAERYGLRLLSPLLNPIAWLLLAGMIWKRTMWGVWACVGSFFLCGFVGSSFRLPRLWVPRIPLGMLTELVRKDLRQLLTALDLYCAILIAAPAAYLRCRGELPPSAQLPLTALVVVMMSTMGLTLFGLDGASGITRYSLWSLARWQVLASKGMAYMLLTFVIMLPLSPMSGLAGGLAALTAGQFVSLKQVIPQVRWRFRASSPFAYSMAQMLFALFAVFMVAQLGVLFGLGLCFAAYAVSLWLCVRQWSGINPLWEQTAATDRRASEVRVI